MLYHWEGPEVGMPASYRLIWARLASLGTAQEGLMSEITGHHMAQSPGGKEGMESALPPRVWLLPQGGNLGCVEAMLPNS